MKRPHEATPVCGWHLDKSKARVADEMPPSLPYGEVVATMAHIAANAPPSLRPFMPTKRRRHFVLRDKWITLCTQTPDKT